MRIWLVCLVWGAVVWQEAQAQVTITLQPVVTTGFASPIGVYNAGDGSGRLFVIEKTGRIKIIDSGGNLLSTPFLNIGPTGLNLIDTASERGLLGLAFHPLYASNGFFYVHYSDRITGNTQISRFTVLAGNPNLADTSSEFHIIGSPPIDVDFAGNHNGGQIEFGPFDGYLYIGLGDGGGGGDPNETGQDLNSYFGKILRIDVDGGTPYAIPPSNPFVGVAGVDEIFAYGLRNPYRFSIDPVTGRLFCGDVGQNAYEEIDIIAAGGNYGWDDMEGLHCFEPMTGCLTANRILPIFEYDRSLGASVTGGLVYRGSQYPAISGMYICGDFVSGRIFVLQETTPNVFQEVLNQTSGLRIVGFGANEQGEMFVVDLGNFSTTFGGVYKIVGPPAPPIPSAKANYWSLY